MPATHTVYLVDASPYAVRAHFSLPLATLVDDMPAARRTSLSRLAYRGADTAAVDTLFERLGFKGIRERVPT